jgi:Spy/CpxP family protein refolding chaperone
MKRNHKWLKLASLIGLLTISGATIYGQTQAQTPDQAATQNQIQTQQQNPNQLPDFRLLNLTPDQIQKIRAINMELKDQRQAANLALRQAQRALAEAVESPTPDETLISQRSRAVAEAQENTIRLRSLTEARILQILTPEQRVRLREMRQRNLALRRAQQQELGKPGLQRGANANSLTPNQRRLQKRQERQQQQAKP